MDLNFKGVKINFDYKCNALCLVLLNDIFLLNFIRKTKERIKFEYNCNL